MHAAILRLRRLEAVLRGWVAGVPGRLNRTMVLAAGAAVALLILALTFTSFERLTLQPRPQRAPEVIPPVRVPAIRLGTAEAPDGQPASTESGEAVSWTQLSPYSGRPLGDRQGLSRILVLRPPFEPVDSLHFRQGGRVFRLAGVEGPHEHAVCEDESKTLWACGRRGRVALYNALRGGDLVCTLRGGEERRGEVEPVTCRVGRQDLALDLIRAGWLRPAGLADRAMQGALEEAREARRGMWDGGWKQLR